MPGLPITIACGEYDRTHALQTGGVAVEGVDLTYLPLQCEETFFRMLKYREFDAGEMSLSSYTMTLGDDVEQSPFVAIPAFVSRAFRHNAIYVNEQSGIVEPHDLVGKTVGVAEFQMTAGVWTRGILADHYGVPVESVHYRTGGMHTPGRGEKVAFVPPEGLDVQPIPSDQTLVDLLVSGGIDALYTPRIPRPYAEKVPGIRRLFADPAAAEAEYFTTSGIFPIMHVIAIRRDVYEKNRWLARSLMKAFEASRQRAMDGLAETAVSPSMMPWMAEEIARTRAVMGDDYWSYGLAGNEPTLDAFLGYSYSQGLAKRRWQPADLFARELREEFSV